MVEDSVYNLLVRSYPNFWGKPEIRLKLEAHLAMMEEEESLVVLRQRRQCARGFVADASVNCELCFIVYIYIVHVNKRRVENVVE